MSLIRRIIIVLVALALAVLMTVLLLNPDSFLPLVNTLSGASALIRLPLIIVIDVIVLVVLILVVRADSTHHQAEGLMVKAKGAIADLSVESVTDRILRAVRAVPDVLSAEAKVGALHGKADIDLSVVVSHQSMNLPEKQRELDRALRQVINKQLGLQLAGKPRVHLRLDNETGASKALSPKVERSEKQEPKPEVKPEPKPEPEPPKAAEPVKPLPHPDAMNLRDPSGSEEKVEASDTSS